jgi:hypothetical protein
MGGGIFSLGAEQASVSRVNRRMLLKEPFFVIFKYRNDLAQKNKKIKELIQKSIALVNKNQFAAF